MSTLRKSIALVSGAVLILLAASAGLGADPVGATVTVPGVPNLNVVKMATDYLLPYVYLLHTSSASPYPSKLIWLNTERGVIVQVLDAGENATDLTVHYGDNRIYVSNWQRAETRVFDREAKRELAPLLLGIEVDRINAGGAGRMITEDRRSYANLRIMDTGDGTQHALRRAPDGDGETTLDGRWYYHCDDGSTGALLRRYDVSSDGFTELESTRTKYYRGSRNVLVSMDGNRVYNCGAIYDAELREIMDLGEEVYAVSAYGDLVVTWTKGFNGVSGAPVYTLPFSCSVMAFSGDQSTLLLFNAGDRTIRAVPTAEIMPVPEPALRPVPESGSVAGANLPELSWSGMPAAVNYAVYLGSDSNAVAAAGTNDVAYLGRVSGTRITVPAGRLTGSETYYWRVDVLDAGGGLTSGPVWDFETAMITVEPYALDLVGAEAAYTQVVEMAVGSAVGGPVAWTAECAAGWVRLGQNTGTAPEPLEVAVDLGGLGAGEYATQIVFSDGTVSIPVPVSLSVERMRIVKMATDYLLPYVYLLHTATGSPNPSKLIWYNTEEEAIEQVLDAGENATDLTVHYGDNRIYVSNHERAETRVFDRDAKRELAPLLLGKDVYSINAGRAGRVITEGGERARYIRLMDTATGFEDDWQGRFYTGDGESTLGGRWYYHCDYGSSGAELLRYDMLDDAFAVAGRVPAKYYSGARNVLVSVDGNRIYNCGAIYDAALGEILDLGKEIYAVSAYGNLVVTETNACDGISGAPVYTLPFASRVMAFSGDQSMLLLFDAATATLRAVPTAEMMPLPEPALRPDPEAGGAAWPDLQDLSWSGLPAALGYDVYLGSDSNAVAAAGTNDVAYLGHVSATQIEMPAGLLEGSRTYYWRVDVTDFSGTVTTGPVWRFRTAAITVAPIPLKLDELQAAYTQTVEMTVSSAVAGPAAWTTECGAGWVLLKRNTGTAPGSLPLEVDLSGLDAGEYATEIVFSDGTVSIPVPVSLSVERMRIVKMATDYLLPYVYLLHTSEEPPNHSKLIWYNTEHGTIEQVLDAGENATDLAVHYGDNRLYVNNWEREETRVFDRHAKRELAPLFMNTEVYQMNAGRAGRLIVQGKDQSIVLRLMDTSDGIQRAQESAPLGDGAITLDGRWYYHSDNDSFNKAHLRRYDVSSDAFTSAGSTPTKYYYGSRNVLVSMDGNRVYNCGAIYDAELGELLDLGEEIYAASAYGDLVVTETNACVGASGTPVYMLPFATRVMAFSGDQSTLLLFDAATATLRAVPTAEIMPLPEPALRPDPGEGSVVWANLPELSWSGLPAALGYEVYVGTDSNAVAAAGTNDTAYVGRTDRAHIGVPEGMLSGSATYYWRVDRVGFGGVVASGSVWSFRTAALTVEPQRLDLEGVQAAYTQAVEVTLGSAVGGPASWSARCRADWVRLKQRTGSAPGTLELEFALSGLDAGEYATQIDVSDGTVVLSVPVTLTVDPMRAVKMATDYLLPYVYVLHTASEAPHPSKLLWFNTERGMVAQVLNAGENATDLTVHYGDNRIYVSNWQRAETRVFDRDAKRELAPLLLGTDVYGINAARAGRVITAGGDQFVDLRIMDTGDGTAYAVTTVREGDGESTPDGRWYFHCENKSSFARLQRYDVSVDGLAAEGSTLTKDYFGSRSVLVSMDGNRVCTRGAIYDTGLREIRDLGKEIYAVSAYGDLVVTETNAFSGVSGVPVYTLPFRSRVMAFSGDQSMLLLFDAATATLQALPTADIMPLPEPALRPKPEAGSVAWADLPELSWSGVPAALGYDVYLASDSNAVAAAGTNDVAYLGRANGTGIAVPAGWLMGSGTYYWRVDTVRAGGVVTPGPVWHFQTAAITVDPPDLELVGVLAAFTQTVEMTVSSAVGGPAAWTAECAAGWLRLSQSAGTAPGTTTVEVDPGALAEGEYTTQIVFSDGAVSLPVPVSLSVERMRIVKMATDHLLPYVYLVHTSEESPNPSMLLWYNTERGVIEQMVDAGENATDLTVHYGDNRIYVSNWQRAETRVFDRDVKRELAPLLLGTDVYNINAGRAGRVIIEGEDQWIDIFMKDTTTGATIEDLGAHEGDGESTTDGLWYYHCENNITNADLFRYGVSSDGFTLSASTRTTYQGGSRNVLVSGDGTRVANCGTIYDAALRVITQLGDEVYALSANGRLAFANEYVYDTETGAHIHTLPVAGSLKALAGDQSALCQFDPVTRQLVLTPIEDISGTPRAVVDTPPQTAALHEPVQFRGRGSGVHPLRYQWLHSGQAIPGATNSVYALPHVAPEDAGDYALRISNPYGTAVSDSVTLTVELSPPVPASLEATPLANSEVLLSWSPTPYADHYRLQRSSSDSGPWAEVGVFGASVSSFTDARVSQLTAYVYRIRSESDLYGTSFYTEPVRVTTLAYALPRPHLLAPLDRLLQAEGTVFRWNAPPDASWYHLLITRNGLAVYSTWVRDAHWTCPWELPPGTYRWWVRSWGPGGLGPWSSSATFEIPNRVPPGVVPYMEEPVLTNRPTFQWDPVEYGLWYRLVLQRNGRTVLNRILAGGTSYTPTVEEALAFGRYRWWVRAVGLEGPGPWSDPYAFVLGVVEPGEPLGHVVGSRRPLFAWSEATGAAWYHLWIRRNGSVYVDEWIPGTASWAPPFDLPPGEYQWYVRAWNARGMGPWSDAAAFSVHP